MLVLCFYVKIEVFVSKYVLDVKIGAVTLNFLSPTLTPCQGVASTGLSTLNQVETAFSRLFMAWRGCIFAGSCHDLS